MIAFGILVGSLYGTAVGIATARIIQHAPNVPVAILGVGAFWAVAFGLLHVLMRWLIDREPPWGNSWM